jgi:hypothetical protein
VAVSKNTQLSGKEKEQTIISSSFSTDHEGSELKILETIPEEVLSDQSELDIFSPHRVIKENELIAFSVDETNSFAYMLNTRLDPEQTKNISSTLFDKEAKKAKGSGITGFAVFSSLNKIEYPLLVIQIGVILLLILIYIFYEFEILVKLQRSGIMQNINPFNQFKKLTDENMSKIHALLKKTKKDLKEEKLPEAEDGYHDMIRIYNDKLASDLRKKVIEEISGVYNELLVHRIKKKISEIATLMKEGKKAKAKKTYQEMQDIYKSLPPSIKKTITNECHNAYHLLAGNAI